MATKLILFLGNTTGVKNVGFQENPSNGNRYTAVKLHLFHVKCPYLLAIATKLIAFVDTVPILIIVEFQKNPSKGNQDTSVNVLCITSKVPFAIRLSQPN
jgi:hypothetical protein